MSPRVVLFGPLEADFAQLQKMFRLLSHSHNRDIELHSASFVVALNGVEITLVSCGSMFARKPEAEMGLRKIQSQQEFPLFGGERQKTERIRGNG
jgi:hypothetical protein